MSFEHWFGVNTVLKIIGSFHFLQNSHLHGRGQSLCSLSYDLVWNPITFYFLSFNYQITSVSNLLFYSLWTNEVLSRESITNDILDLFSLRRHLRPRECPHTLHSAALKRPFRRQCDRLDRPSASSALRLFLFVCFIGSLHRFPADDLCRWGIPRSWEFVALFTAVTYEFPSGLEMAWREYGKYFS